MFVQSFANDADAAVHHVGGSDDVGTGARVRDGLLGKDFERGIVGHFAVFDDAAMAVVGVFAQANIGDDQTDFSLALRMASMARCTTPSAAMRAGAARIFLLGQPEQNHARNAERFDFAAFFDNLIGGLLKHAGHGADFLAHFLPGADKHRIDQALRR